ncbi:CCA tRNA nucleotidyltransferase [Mesorhizobium sp. M1C.F.Ca.ET.193.01.1.1]|uniref:CCA tRNA nucleotidyltransferase n=1 Tax=unclassified Mesorhizobium TaxID=325217 RepID=UPI000FD379EC|nr:MULTISPECIES: CCA tRNA nucleotidyltransferase [unclassified Mesorhizobium]TGT02085.1 CCA tRNA nucleotidyltransferase [bacterium M00.F.Ca.ET.177.01.1.1]TGQ54338.1 CCA tRNA nucleotidyltransferase [Mesorhizobium sp. M1C.F.Ca.ET.210.01.1.1]TGQ72333.1 CCA tRNA nucleotidyltransferase [Mesorhizobium sp. M1C.F.Ca.ET.212.01.1.1]TGR10130.1 CCA tRNA nucleotidyltransferase [Mesorhizobium sp. M1C.F.Ca.ET.204.01.1.1]TGR30733.1 CCA tRNA nucleotidyltransferase [Mesorhizobium sp. M1C.F.Ca.ET.196.01.1.1]
MSAGMSLSGRADWLGEKHLQKLLAALKEGGEEARVAGGAVRNALIGQPVADIDIATTTVPEETIRRTQAAGFKTVPTGIEHGTITAIAGGKAYEVTTLRADIETDGRRAKVIFGRDWKADAERRDFTINALYAEADGTLVDLVGGVADIEARRLRFIGEPEARIREDYLRILRFFRFFAWYGDGRPDAEGLKACARLKDGLSRLSAERVWSELKKLFSAPDPSRALLWMRQAGVLTAVLPESEKWGIDAIHGLVRAERDLGWSADPLLRLEAMVPPDAARMKTLAERLRFSNEEADRLRHWALAAPPEPKTTETELSKKLYFGDRQGFLDRLRLALAAARTRAVEDNQAMMEAGGFSRLLNFTLRWAKPVFPIKGADLTELGASPGPKLGATLKNLEKEWVDSGFILDRGALLKRAAQALEA